ncbi:hypothetical protein E2C06_21205 [Dankookia rubra]|uniref:Hyalin n=1 Tax=Dankookia rubra TaxID=1442381 RepID=A0A4V3A9T8_9PROT|nr:hypothetical protein [Dankookia rubra]TDH60565.1 hypothetical protein E2C06_21205 [Dankookia rubra]
MTDPRERNAITAHEHAHAHDHGHGSGHGHGPGASPGCHAPGGASPPSFVFAADDGSHGAEPWVSDGTAAGTHLLRDIRPGPDASGHYSTGNAFLYGATAFVPASGGRFVFEANDATHGDEPWVTDGTSRGTQLLADLAPGPESSFPLLFTPLGDGRVLFGTTGGAEGTGWAEIGTRYWITDGSAEGTREAPQFESGSRFFGAGDFAPLGDGRIVFTFASELRVATPDAPSSEVVRSFAASPFNADLGYLTALGDGRAVFRADDGIHGIEPWITDGTAAGTHLLADLNPGGDGSFAAGFTALGDGRALFTADDSLHGRELWITDATEAGTQLVADIRPGANGSQLLYLIPIGGGRVLFSANDGVHGEEPWVSDGTTAGTMLLRDIYPGPVRAGGPGIPALGNSFPGDIIPLGDGRALFSAFDPEQGQELWVSDGTPAGTHVVADLVPGTGSSSPSSIGALGRGLAAFAADDGSTGREPWITDGTEAGTHRLADINPGAAGSGAQGFTPLPLAEHAPIG